MKTIILLCLCVAGSLANSYGSVSVSYGQNTPAVVTYGGAPATPVRAALRSSYSAPAPAAPVARVPSYAAPVPAAPIQSYSAPVPAAPIQSYSAPVPAAPIQSYSAPAPASETSYGASSDPVVPPIAIMRFTQEMQEMSHHRHSYETEHGIRQEEHTSIRLNPGASGNADDALAGSAMITKKGSFSYLSPEGQTITTEYIADENGFQPKGQHLPVAPENTLEVVQAIREFEAAYDVAARAAAANPEVPQNNGYGGSRY